MRHCERSDASSIQPKCRLQALDCFVALLLAMTANTHTINHHALASLHTRPRQKLQHPLRRVRLRLLGDRHVPILAARQAFFEIARGRGRMRGIVAGDDRAPECRGASDPRARRPARCRDRTACGPCRRRRACICRHSARHRPSAKSASCLMTEAQGPPRGSVPKGLPSLPTRATTAFEPVLLHEGQVLGEALVARQTIFGAADRPIEDHAQHALGVGDAEGSTGEQPMQPPIRWALSIFRWSSNLCPAPRNRPRSRARRGRPRGRIRAGRRRCSYNACVR